MPTVKEGADVLNVVLVPDLYWLRWIGHYWKKSNKNLYVSCWMRYFIHRCYNNTHYIFPVLTTGLQKGELKIEIWEVVHTLVHIQAWLSAAAHTSWLDLSPWVTNVQQTMSSEGYTAAPHSWVCNAVSNLRMSKEDRGKSEGSGVCVYILLQLRFRWAIPLYYNHKNFNLIITKWLSLHVN